MCKLFGGPSEGEYSVQQQEQGLGAALESAFNVQYAQQQYVLRDLGAQIAKIQTGQTGPGYSGAENAAYVSQIVNQGAANARNAVQASRAAQAGVAGGGADMLGRMAGSQQAVAGGIQALTGANTANQLLAETAANYRQGRENAAATVSGLEALQGNYNPLGYASARSANLGAQWGIAKDINQQQQQRAANIAGFATKLALGAATFGVGGIGALGAGESLGEGAKDFMSGGLNALSGSNFGISGPSQGGSGDTGGWLSS